MGLNEVKGQNRAVKLLQTALRTGRVSHAYLFFGPDGVGKNKTARIFAQALNCLKFPQGGPCGNCDNCKRIESGNFPDVIRIAPEGASLKIAQIRQLQEKASYHCYEGRFKVIMIDDAHLMTPEAANCLLKILEDPPGDTVFVLLAENTTALPPTILSRTQAIPFTALDDHVLADILAEQGLASSVPLGLADGSVKKARELVQDGAPQKNLQDVIQLRQDVKQGSYQRLLGWSENLEKNKAGTRTILRLLAIIYRDGLLRQLAKEEADTLKREALHGMLFGMPRKMIQEIGRGETEVCQEDSLSIGAYLAALEAISKAQGYLQGNANARLVLDVLLLKLHNIEGKERGLDPVG